MNAPIALTLGNGIGFAMVMLLSACSASSTSSDQTTVSSAHEPWFCETGVDGEAWNCVHSETLARSPQPSRSPPRRAPSPQGMAPVAQTSAVQVERSPPPIPTEPISQIAAQTAPLPARDAADQAASGARLPSNEDHLPKHVRLAYRPESAVPMMDIPPEFWAVQLIALSSKEALEAFARQHNVKGMPAARIAVDRQLFYILLLGIYETRALADEASSDLPAPFTHPWIRSVRSLQRAMTAADELAGGEMLDE